MENRKPGLPRSPIVPYPAKSSFEFRFPILVLLLCAGGCAAPGEPLERKPVVAQKIADLTAMQAGNDVVLDFTVPTESVDHRPLTGPVEIEIYRGISAPDAESGERMALLVTIPSAEVDQYASQGRFQYVDPLKAEDFAGYDDRAGVSYSIRTRASAKADSDTSNVAYLQVRPAFEAVADLKTQVARSAIVLSWTPPAKTLSGSTPPVAKYQIYRSESTTREASALETAASLAKIGESELPTFQDTQFQFGKTYVYSVRSVLGSGPEALESSDSNLVTVTPRDTFPPAAPAGLVVALVPKQAETSAHFELSWAISLETDVAGYNVYRSDREGTAGARLNSEVLLTPAFRDMNVEPGHRYFYIVTAVDRSGNEGPASEAVSGSVPAENQ